jgi:uncharacterized circularly permuted ATP-grasp superfamily protein
MGDLFERYAAERAGSPAWDEMFCPDGMPRSASRTLHDSLQTLSEAELVSRATALSREFHEHGVTFSRSGQETIFPLDLVPRVISAAEWRLVERGVAQRVRALEAFLDDVYGDAAVLADGIVPHALVTTSRHFHRAAHGFRPPNGVRIHISGVDLVRDEEGAFRVLEDNLRCPSGVSYVIENRRTMARVFPKVFNSERIRPVSDYPARLLAALRAAAPSCGTIPASSC